MVGSHDKHLNISFHILMQFRLSISGSAHPSSNSKRATDSALQSSSMQNEEESWQCGEIQRCNAPVPHHQSNQEIKNMLATSVLCTQDLY